jgi:hypothetical protein
MKGYGKKGGTSTKNLKHKPGYYCPKGSGPSLPADFGGKYTDYKSPHNNQGKN